MTPAIKSIHRGAWIAGVVLALMLAPAVPAAAQTVTIVKETVPQGSPQDFTFSGSGTIGSFDLDADDGDMTLPSSESFSVTAGTYTVSELVPEGWFLTELWCLDPTENSSTDVDDAAATVVVDGTETVTCTFQNTAAGKIIVDKVTFPTGDLTAFDFTLSEVEGDDLAVFSLADQDPPYMIFLPPGNYAVFEAEDEGYSLDNFPGECVGGGPVDVAEYGFADDIILGSGDVITCTFINIISAQAALPDFSKAFDPATIGPGSSSRLTFTIDNTSEVSTPPVSLLTFEDVLPSELVIADAPGVVTDCGTPSIDAPAGGDTIRMSFGSVGPDSICTLSVNVTSDGTAGEGPFTNTSGDLTSNAGNSGAAVADLTVSETRVGFSKSFSPASIPLGATSTMTFTFANDHVGAASANHLQFTDFLPDGMVVATPANAASDCGSFGGAFSFGEPGSNALTFIALGTFAAPALPAGSTCTATIDVTATAYGVHENVTEVLFLENPLLGTVPGDAGFATAVLEVPFDFINKLFVDDPVAPGGTVELQFTLQNPSRDFPATGIAFTDDLTFLTDLMATGLPLTEACDPDGPGGSPGTGTLSGTTALSFSGGSLPPEGECTFSVTLSVPAGANPDTYTNTTSAITATIDGEAVVGNTASDQLTVSLAPTFTKEYLTSPVGAGGTTTLRFTITNNTSAYDLADVAFIDEFNDVTPTSTGPPMNGCGGTATFTPFNDAAFNSPATLTFSGGALAASDSCTIELTLNVVTNATEGIYPNVTSTITGTLEPAGAMGGGTVPGTRSIAPMPFEGLPAADDLIVVGGPWLSKQFIGDPVNPPGAVTLEFTVSHSEFAALAATGITFTDDLAALSPAIAGLTASGLPVVDPCGPGSSLTGSAGDTFLTFAGGSLDPGASCTFSVMVTVPGGDPGPHTNTTSTISAMVGALPVTGNPASDVLDVAGLLLTKEFLDDPVLPGDTVTLEFVIKNLNTAVTATDIVIRDDMATILGGTPDITATDGSPVADVCGMGNGTISWSRGDTFMLFSGGTLAPGEMCVFSVVLDVPAGAASGTYVNATGDGENPGFLAKMPGPSFTIFAEATDDLVVDNVFLELTKKFTDDPVAPGGTATLEFTITNLEPLQTIENIEFSDDLDAALLGLEAIAAPVNTCGGMGSGFPTGFFDYSGGSLPGGATCTIELTLAVPSLPAGTLAFNTTSPITGTLGVEGPDVVGDPATDELRLGFLTFDKAFAESVKPGETVDLTFTLTNLGDAVASDIGFTDNLDDVLAGLVATGLPDAACGGTVLTPDMGSTIALINGSLAAAGSPGDSCTFAVTLDVPGEASPGLYTNTTSDLLQGGASVADPAVADLEIEPVLEFSKEFLPATIGPGSTTRLELTIANPESGALAEEVAFTDVLPAGVIIATPSSAMTDCTDGVLTAPDGGTAISLSGARVGDGARCTVSVNVTAAVAGEYENLSGELTSTAGSGGTAEATLVVDADLPGFSKSFAPATIPPGGTSTLTFVIDLSAAGDGAEVAGLSFTDMLPAGLVVATPSNAVTDCEGGLGPAVLTADPGTGVIVLGASGLPGFPSLEAGETCTVVVDVTAASDDLYENVSGDLFTGPIGTFDPSAGFATAELDVREGFLVKSFTDDPVPPGGTVTLEFTINNPSRDFTAAAISFTDDLDAVLPGTLELSVFGPLPSEPCGTGSTLTAPANVLTLTGGNLPAEGSCTFGVTLEVPVGAATGIHLNTTSSITATIDGATEEGDPASDELRVVGFPIFVKEFLDATTLDPDPVVGAGDEIVLRFTITNTSTTSAATDIAFVDVFDPILPTASMVPADGSCGAGSDFTFTALTAFDPAMLVLAGGMLAPAGMAGDSCTFDITLDVVDSAATGTYVNTTGEITAMVDGEVVFGFPASDSFEVVAAPRLTKEFIDDPVQPGGTVTLEFTLEHDALAPGDAQDIQFTDDLAAVVADLAAAAGQLPLADVCGPGNGTVVGTAGDTLLTFSGATLTPGQTCAFSVTLDVPVDAPAGTHTNTTSNVVATVLGVEATESPGEDDLTVGGLIVTKEFIDDPVIAGGTVTLEFVITNLTPEPVSDIFFEDLLDPDVLEGLTVVTPMPLVDPCGMGSLLEVFSAPEIPFPPTPAIDEALRLTGGNLPAATGVEGEGTCTFAVELMVPSTTPSGTYVNRTRDLEAVIGSTTLPFPDAQDDLVVATGQLLLTKEFTDDPVAPGGTVTLEFTIATLGPFNEASDLAFSDDLGAALAGLEAVPPFDTGTCGGTLTGTSLLDFSGGSLTGGECAFSVAVQVPGGLPIGSTATNVTSTLTGTIGGLPVTGEPATDVLQINSFVFSKAFDGPTTPGGTPVLTFTIENLSMTESVADLSFVDDLNLIGFPGLEATGLPLEPCGVGSSISGTSVLTLTGGNLLPGGSCTFAVDLLVPPGTPGGSYLNETGDLEIVGLPVAAPATASLQVDAPPTFAKVFVPEVIVAGLDSMLTFTIDNSNSTVDVTGLTFLDMLPFNLIVAADPGVVNACGGTVVASAGSTTIELSGGTVGAGSSCTISVQVTAPSPGTFLNISGDLTSSAGDSGPAVNTLAVVDCTAADGTNLILGSDVVLGTETYEVCDTIEIREHYLVLGPGGVLTLRAGVAVIIFNGVEFGPESEVTIEIDPALAMP